MTAPQPFLGQFIAKTEHKTELMFYPTYIYIFRDSTSPLILLLYTALDRSGILEFKVPNGVPSTPLNTVMTLESKKITKSVTFCMPLESTQPETPPSPVVWRSSNSPWRPCHPATPSYTLMSQYPLPQWQPVISLPSKRPFPVSLTHYMYYIHTIPSIPPVQHAQWKVPNEYHDQIKKTLDKMVTSGFIALVTWLTEWVSSLTYPASLMAPSAYVLTPKISTKPSILCIMKLPPLIKFLITSVEQLPSLSSMPKMASAAST